jgi:hypothetical protein
MIRFAWKYPGEFKPGDVLLSNGDYSIVGIIEWEPLRGDDDVAYLMVHDLLDKRSQLVALPLNEGLMAYPVLTVDHIEEQPSKERGRTVMKQMRKAGQ